MAAGCPHGPQVPGRRQAQAITEPHRGAQPEDRGPQPRESAAQRRGVLCAQGTEEQRVLSTCTVLPVEACELWRSCRRQDGETLPVMPIDQTVQRFLVARRRRLVDT